MNTFLATSPHVEKSGSSAGQRDDDEKWPEEDGGWRHDVYEEYLTTKHCADVADVFVEIKCILPSLTPK